MTIQFISPIPYSSFDSKIKMIIVKIERFLSLFYFFSFNKNIYMAWISVFNEILEKSEAPIYFMASSKEAHEEGWKSFNTYSSYPESISTLCCPPTSTRNKISCLCL